MQAGRPARGGASGPSLGWPQARAGGAGALSRLSGLHDLALLLGVHVQGHGLLVQLLQGEAARLRDEEGAQGACACGVFSATARFLEEAKAAWGRGWNLRSCLCVGVIDGPCLMREQPTAARAHATHATMQAKELHGSSPALLEME